MWDDSNGCVLQNSLYLLMTKSDIKVRRFVSVECKNCNKQLKVRKFNCEGENKRCLVETSPNSFQVPGDVFSVRPPVTEEEVTFYLATEQSWPRQTTWPFVPLSAKSGQSETAGSSEPILEAVGTFDEAVKDSRCGVEAEQTQPSQTV